MYTIVRKSTENNNLLLTGIGITLSKKKTNAMILFTTIKRGSPSLQ
jgi:hypothetical protein